MVLVSIWAPTVETQLLACPCQATVIPILYSLTALLLHSLVVPLVAFRRLFHESNAYQSLCGPQVPKKQPSHLTVPTRIHVKSQLKVDQIFGGREVSHRRPPFRELPVTSTVDNQPRAPGLVGRLPYHFHNIWAASDGRSMEATHL